MIAALRTAPPVHKPFPLQGHNDVYDALPSPPSGGALEPSISQRLVPCLVALKQTTEALGKHPSPQEVDVSNLRRLMRALLPLAEAHADQFPHPPRVQRAMETLEEMVSAIGHYKDVFTIGSTIKPLFPRGAPAALHHEETKRREAFDKALHHFRKHGLAEVLDAFSHPQASPFLSPQALEQDDQQRMQRVLRHAIQDVDMNVEETPHETRKSLRGVLHAALASGVTADLTPLRELVDGLGTVHDMQLSSDWLKEQGYKREAALLLEQRDALLAVQIPRLHALKLSGLALSSRDLHPQSPMSHLA